MVTSLGTLVILVVAIDLGIPATRRFKSNEPLYLCKNYVKYCVRHSAKVVSFNFGFLFPYFAANVNTVPCL